MGTRAGDVAAGEGPRVHRGGAGHWPTRAYGDVTEFRTALAADGFAYVLSGSAAHSRVIAADADLGAVPSAYARVRRRPPTRLRRRSGPEPRRYRSRDWAPRPPQVDFRTISPGRDGTQKETHQSLRRTWRVRPAHQLSCPDGTAPRPLAPGRVAGRGRRTHEVLLRPSPRRHLAPPTRDTRQEPVLRRAQLQGVEGRTRPRPLRGPVVAGLASPRHPGPARLRLPATPPPPGRKKRGTELPTLPALRRLLQRRLNLWTGRCPVCRLYSPDFGGG